MAKCSDPPAACEILAPRPDEAVGPRGVVRFRALEPELFATIIVCSPSNNVCYNQNPQDLPIETHAGETLDVAVQYDKSGRYAVHVAVTADPNFLRGEHEWPFVPRSHESNRLVRWCGPVEVTFPSPRTKGARE